MNPYNGDVTVGYVVKVFPRLSETFIVNEILELERQGISVEVFSLKPPADPRFHGSLGRLRAPVTYLPYLDGTETWRKVRADCLAAAPDAGSTGDAFLHAVRLRDPMGLRLFLQAISLAAAVRNHGIQHLHAHFATGATSVAMMAHLMEGVSFSFTAHAKDIYHNDVDTAALAEAVDRAAFAVTVTDHNVATLSELAPRARHKLYRIYNGLALDEFAPSPEPATESPVVLSVGRLVEKKGFPYLIEACRLLKDRGRRYRCVIIGAGERGAELRELTSRLGLTAEVGLAGAQSQEAVIEAIRESSMLVLPCIIGEDGNRDALPTVLLEAMALARPVISTDLAGVTEIVGHGETGLLAPQRDSAALARAIEELLDSRTLRDAYGRAGRRKAERLFNIRANVAELADLFRQAAGQPTGTEDRGIPAGARA